MNKAINGYVSGGVLNLCSPGCSECSTKICTKCVSAFVLDSNSALCKPCGPGCTVCDANNPLICSECYAGMYLSSTSCLPCSVTCAKCSGSADSCSSCLPGQYFNINNQVCRSCSRNCLTCSSESTCTLCRKGFVVTSAGGCRGCSLSCSSCSASDITQCTSCAVGLELSGSQCVQCPSNCQVCNKGFCQTCAPGYTPTDGTCSLNCQLPCATCATNQPTICLSCYGSATLNGNSCIFDTSCNATATCTDCGQGLGLFLFDSKCYSCNSVVNIPNCLQCSQTQQQICSICEDAYYINS